MGNNYDDGMNSGPDIDDTDNDEEEICSIVKSDEPVNATSALLSLKPIYMVGYCADDDEKDNLCCSVAILLFSGTDDITYYSLHVVDEHYLEYTVLWPYSLTNALQLHGIWLQGKRITKLTKYHPLIKCFNSFFRKHSRTESRIQSTTRIPLSMNVETRFETKVLSFSGSTARVLDVILRAPARKELKEESGAIPFIET